MMRRKKYSFILSFLLVVLITVTALTGCGNDDRNGNDYTIDNEVEAIGGLGTDQAGSMELFPEIGEGEHSFLFEMVNDEDMSYFWVVHTDETMVGYALVELGLIDGEDSEFGFFINEVNGLVADFNADQTFWAFYIDGEFAMTGVMDTEIEPDTIYAFVFTQG